MTKILFATVLTLSTAAYATDNTPVQVPQIKTQYIAGPTAENLCELMAKTYEAEEQLKMDPSQRTVSMTHFTQHGENTNWHEIQVQYVMDNTMTCGIDETNSKVVLLQYVDGDLR